MILEQEIKEWWKRKISNYLQNYARRNKLTIAKDREKLCIGSREKFLEDIPQEIKKFLDNVHDHTKIPG